MLKIHAKKGALEQVYLLLHSCDFREGHTFQHKPPVSDDAVPAEHAGNDDDDALFFYYSAHIFCVSFCVERGYGGV